MSTKLEPTGDRLIVEPIEEDLVTRSGIILPEQARERPQRGRIIALGPEVNAGHKQFRHADPSRADVPLDPGSVHLALGDEVLYSKYGGTELKIDLREVVLLRETDVFCRIQEASEAEYDPEELDRVTVGSSD